MGALATDPFDGSEIFANRKLGLAGLFHPCGRSSAGLSRNSGSSGVQSRAAIMILPVQNNL